MWATSGKTTRSSRSVRSLLARSPPSTSINATMARMLISGDYAMSYARIRNEGFETQIPLEDGIRELCSALQWIDQDET